MLYEDSTTPTTVNEQEFIRQSAETLAAIPSAEDARKLTKRPATPEESDAMIRVYEKAYPETDYRSKEAEMVAQGLSAEVCDCGKCLPAFVHFVRCCVKDCPFIARPAKSMLDYLMAETEVSE